jgi:hypothetical protein
MELRRFDGRVGAYAGFSFRIDGRKIAQGRVAAGL